MLHLNNDKVREHLLKGEFGLEKENLRVLKNGTFSHKPHPFLGDKNIDRDFCENQVEINTGVSGSAREAQRELLFHSARVQEKLMHMQEQELLWPFSNPPYIHCENDIPIAQFTGELKSKTGYREYLSDRYGRYKMTLSGIHVNYSFSDELLHEDFKLSGYNDFKAYKDELYMEAAKKAAAYGWLITALTAASPVCDSSFIEQGVEGTSVFTGFASVRCSQSGYWNYFTPVLDYSSLEAYGASIQGYIDKGCLASASELYYPVRVKSAGAVDAKKMAEDGANHLELRMVDLNPFEVSGLNLTDLEFIQLFIIWLESIEMKEFSAREQIQAAHNFKTAANYDVDMYKIVLPGAQTYTVSQAALMIIGKMKEFYREYPGWVMEILGAEAEKMKDETRRYAYKVRHMFSDDYVDAGLKLAQIHQKEAVKVLKNK